MIGQICVGIRVIYINDDGIGLCVIRSYEVIDEGLSDQTVPCWTGGSPDASS